MTASPDDWRSSPQGWFQQQDRDTTRDRLKDLEHARAEHDSRLDGHDTELGWHKAALGLLAWVMFNAKLATWTPELAAAIAAILKGLIK